jgi:hypothetical protein
MQCMLSRRQFVKVSAAGSLGLASGCGTIFYPERRGQPAGDLDWKIVALDALGLLFFFIPGIIAFAVDFSTGAIYLPPVYYGASPPGDEELPLAAVSVPRDELTQQRLEQVVSQHAGREVKLVEGQYETVKLASLDDFWPTRNLLAQA